VNKQVAPELFNCPDSCGGFAYVGVVILFSYGVTSGEEEKRAQSVGAEDVFKLAWAMVDLNVFFFYGGRQLVCL
jgi:hypothetical protein